MPRYRYAYEESLPSWLQDNGSEDELEAAPPRDEDYGLDPAWSYDDYGAIPHHESPADASYDYEQETPHREPPRRGHPGDIY